LEVLPMAYSLAVDIGGTFTDVVLINTEGKVLVTKVPTTPHDPTEGLLNGIRKTGAPISEVKYFAHGTTIALNTLLQRNGAKVGLITTRGFRDVQEIMRTNRPDMYNLQQDKPEPLVPRYLCYEISERLNHEGDEIAPVVRAQVLQAAKEMHEQGVEAIAVSLLHSYANPDHEIQVKLIIEEEFPSLSVTISSDLTREWREFERTSTAVINAYTLPAMEDYLTTVDDRLVAEDFTREVLIMQSNGGIMAARDARSQPIRTIMSGPAGGIISGEYLSNLTGMGNMITFDMGGTSADICLIIDGKATIRSVQEIDRLPVLQPSIDITSIGAGGGSIAWLDRGNALRVGPRSGGAVPGPVCYGRGGTDPTVTDANLVLGYIDPNYFLGGEIQLDLEGAQKAIEQKIAIPLSLTTHEAAEGIIQIVNANMMRALRKVSVEHGHDPRDFALLAFGGAGGLHAAQLGRELGLRRVVLPQSPGATSAMGMLVADVRHDYTQTYVQSVISADTEHINERFSEMEGRGRSQLLSDGVSLDDIVCHRTADIRYSGQEYTLNGPVPDGQITSSLLYELSEKFHELHEKLYTYRIPEEETVFVNLRVTAIGKNPAPAIYEEFSEAKGEARSKGNRNVYFRETGHVNCKIYERSDLAPGHRVIGPAIIEEPVSTTLVPLDSWATVDAHGNLYIEFAKGSELDDSTN
jgi:N-methylhydantoinase A